MDHAPFDLPIAPPPPGQKSDFDAPAHDAKALWVLALLTVTLAFLAVGVRMYVKGWITKQRVSWDDAACIVALLLAITHTYIILKELDYGLGKHMWDVRAVSLTHFGLLIMLVSNLIIALNMLFVRISILALYHRLFAIYKTSKRLIYLGYGISLLIALPEFGVAIIRIVRCSTALGALTDSYCKQRPNSIMITTFTAVGVLTDIFIYSIAISRIRLVQVKRNKKVQLIVVFAMGLAALVFAVANLTFVSIHFHTTDQLWYAFWVALFKLLETNIGLACACATFLPPFWKAWRTTLPSIGSGLRVRSQDTSNDDGSGWTKSGVSNRHRSDDALVDTFDLHLDEINASK